jgi:hypothetical protein
VLNSAASGQTDPQALSDEPVLGSIVEGYQRLSKKLEELRAFEGAHERPTSDYPKYADKTNLQQFPFRHLHPFLDLLPSSQLRLIQTLAHVSAQLNQSGIMTARNGLLHSKQRVPTVSEVEEALRKAREALDELESIGCVRGTYTLSSTQVNAWGGATSTLVSNGRAISFSAPSSFEWAKLPGLSRPVYLMQGAVFALPNEMLRFAEGFESEYKDYWLDFPKRPQAGNRIVADQSPSAAAPIDAGSYSSSRSS